jgi:tellurite resistance protein
MASFSLTRLEALRDALKARGQRQSIIMGGSVELIEAMEFLGEWGAFVEAMYIMMAVDRKVMNVERQVLRGALAILSDEKLRTRHMEAMLDAASRSVAAEGVERRLEKALRSLRQHPTKAESAVLVAAAIATADDRLVPEELDLLKRMIRDLAIDETRSKEILAEVEPFLVKTTTT